MGISDKSGRKSWTDLRETDDARRLREFSAFDKFSDDELMRLVRMAHHDSSSAPWPLIHEQTPSHACYILLSGEVGVYVGRERIATLGPGEVIGESALRQGTLRSATVTTNGPTEVLRIEADDLATLLNEIPALREVIHTTAERHAPVAVADSSPHLESNRSKVNASVPAELVSQFEQAAKTAGVPLATALEGALSDWIERNS